VLITAFKACFIQSYVAFYVLALGKHQCSLFRLKRASLPHPVRYSLLWMCPWGKQSFFIQISKRASFWSPKPALARNHKSNPGPNPTFTFEAQFRLESQVYWKSRYEQLRVIGGV